MARIGLPGIFAAASLFLALAGCGTAGQDIPPQNYVNGVLQPRPERDKDDYGVLRHGSKFGISIGMPEAEVGPILLGQNGRYINTFTCQGKLPACTPTEPDRTLVYAIHQYGVLTVPGGMYVEVNIKDGKVSQIGWARFFGEGW